MIAVKSESMHCLKLLILNNADVSQPNQLGRTPGIVQYVSVVSIVLSLWACQATTVGNPFILKILADNDADLSTPDKEGVTPGIDQHFYYLQPWDHYEHMKLQELVTQKSYEF